LLDASRYVKMPVKPMSFWIRLLRLSVLGIPIRLRKSI
jgi:hypothetical protein